MINKIFFQAFACWIILACYGTLTFAQSQDNYNRYLYNDSSREGKPALNLNFKKNDQLGRFNAISRNGRFCSYVIEGLNNYTIVQSTGGDWRQKLAGTHPGFFTGDNKFYIYQTGDSLCYLSLKEGKNKVLEDVTSYQLPPNDNRNEWLAVHLKDKSMILFNLISGKTQRFNDVDSYTFSYGGKWFSCQCNNADKDLIILDLETEKVQRFRNVKSYSFDKSLRVLICSTEKLGVTSLDWIDPISGETIKVWSTVAAESRVVSYMVDKSCDQLVFAVKDTSTGVDINSLWYYKKGMNRAVQKEINDEQRKTNGMKLIGDPIFTEDGRYIIIAMQKYKIPAQKPFIDAVKLDVWNYRDTFLMSAQVSGKNPDIQTWLDDAVCRFSVSVTGSGNITYLSGACEELIAALGGYALIKTKLITDRFWEDWAQEQLYLVSLRDGKRKALRKEIIMPQFSPDRNWLFCYDRILGHYLRYDIKSGLYRDLSGESSTYFGGENEFDGKGRQPALPRGQVGWLEGGKALLVYDHYDIWKLDVNGKKQPINLTNGRKNKIRFELAWQEPEDVGKGYFPTHAQLVLSAVNMDNKDNGMYALSLCSYSNPEQLCMGKYMIYLGGLTYGQSKNWGIIPQKARDANVWLLRKQSATEAPNYFISEGLKTFKALTNLQPQKDYNWLRTELINFKQQDGSNSKGILYKPENFDPSKKYPVLINYYDQSSMCLNQYPSEGYTASGHINIPWFVSRGYLIFLPDIYFNKGRDVTGEIYEAKIPYGAAALNAVEGAANWLSKQNYVDSTKMGIAGHSMAGGLTSYILTHSKRFAAVFMGAGVNDWITSSLQLSLRDGISRLGAVYYSGPTGADIWTNNAKYLENPILHVASIASPLLMFHCKADAAVPFEQAIELFVGMQRMGKKVWLLQYDDGSHSTRSEKDSRDLTIRVTQFFDHYLKGAPAPIWMTQGIRATMKGIQTGYEWDTSGRQP